MYILHTVGRINMSKPPQVFLGSRFGLSWDSLTASKVHHCGIVLIPSEVELQIRSAGVVQTTSSRQGQACTTDG